MERLNNITIILIMIITLIACDDILEEDISNDVVQITSPMEGAMIDDNTVQFSWQNLEGADNYRIQIIKSNQEYELDSLVSTNTFTQILDQGSYQWRVKGENFAYQTSFNFPVNFSIETSLDLSGQSVVLLTPSENLYTNNKDIIFSWEEIAIADSYSFMLIKNLNGEQTVYQQEDILTESLSIEASSLDEDSEYIWKVKAVNGSSETSFSQKSFFVDTVVPNQPTLSSPVNGEIVSPNTVVFNWINGADSGNIQSLITNTFEISTDIDFNTILHSVSTTNNSTQYEFVASNTYYWRVKAIDAATNNSDYSIVRLITVE